MIALRIAISLVSAPIDKSGSSVEQNCLCTHQVINEVTGRWLWWGEGEGLEGLQWRAGLAFTFMSFFDLSFLMAYPDVIPSAFIKLKEVFAVLVLSTRQETLPVPFSEWLEYVMS